MPIFSRYNDSKFTLLAAAILGLFILSWLLPAQARAGVLHSVGAVAAQDNVVLTVKVTRGFESASSFALAAPDRIALDIEGATASAGTAARTTGIKGIRIAQYNARVTRLVVDLSQPMIVADAVINAEKTELRLTLKPVDAGGFAKLVKAPRRHYAQPVAVASAQPRTEAAPVQPAVPANQAIVTAPVVNNNPASVASAPQPSPAARRNRPLVVIDPGHGGHDTGALSVYDGRREKDVTLAIAKAIKQELDASGRVRTVLTRSDDRFLVLAERREVARRLKADLFISVHADSAGNPDASGATVYTLSEVASDREAARLAARENKSDIINGVDLGKEASDVTSILIDLARRDTMNVSSSFAALLQREMAPYVKFKSEFHRFAGFVVLKAPDTPSVLMETGYLSNMEDSKFLFSTRGQKAIAKGVKNAVEAHFARRYRTR